MTVNQQEVLKPRHFPHIPRPNIDRQVARRLLAVGILSSAALVGGAIVVAANETRQVPTGIVVPPSPNNTPTPTETPELKNKIVLPLIVNGASDTQPPLSTETPIPLTSTPTPSETPTNTPTQEPPTNTPTDTSTSTPTETQTSTPPTTATATRRLATATPAPTKDSDQLLKELGVSTYSIINEDGGSRQIRFVGPALSPDESTKLINELNARLNWLKDVQPALYHDFFGFSYIMNGGGPSELFADPTSFCSGGVCTTSTKDGKFVLDSPDLWNNTVHHGSDDIQYNLSFASTAAHEGARRREQSNNPSYNQFVTSEGIKGSQTTKLNQYAGLIGAQEVLFLQQKLGNDMNGKDYGPTYQAILHQELYFAFGKEPDLSINPSDYSGILSTGLFGGNTLNISVTSPQFADAAYIINKRQNDSNESPGFIRT